MERYSKIFVAGGSGMVGSAIIRRLVSSGYNNVVSNFHNRLPTHETSVVRWNQLDLTRQSDTEAFFQREHPEYVFLAAAKVGGILANSTYPADFIYNNIAIATNIIHSSYRYKVKKLLNLGSSCIYPREAPQPLREEYLLTGALEPTNEAYAVAKIAAIKLCRYYNQQYATNFISAMPTNLYGPHDSFDLENSHVLPALLRKFHLAKLLSEGEIDLIKKDFLKGGNCRFVTDSRTISIDENSSIEDVLDALRHFGIYQSSAYCGQSSGDSKLKTQNTTPTVIFLWGSGKPYREFLHVDDLAQACLFLVESDFDFQREIINIGAGKDMTIADLAELVRRAVGFEGVVKYDQSKPDGMMRKVLDISQINALGWKPTIFLDKGISQVYEWYRKRC